ncbi:MAG: hypothetical protein E7521_07185 [Ruminococcaceae bacterium]|nr:hypothetical protein [Oscillospiraceae bacterium]
MKRIFSMVLCCVFLFCLSACEKFDENYGKSSARPEKSENKTSSEEIKIPEIKSDDEIMPTYVDISLYDEENYADIYLGKDFKYKITYVGSALEVPTTYKNMTQEGWSLVESPEYDENSQILAGKSITTEFINEYNKKITAVFYNSKKSSVPLKKCSIVKFIVKENIIDANAPYGQFFVNGVNNVSAITDIIERLGSPSHFYRVAENKYYLDWFISEKDRRSGITIYVDTAEDRIDSIEFSYY